MPSSSGKNSCGNWPTASWKTAPVNAPGKKSWSRNSREVIGGR